MVHHFGCEGIAFSDDFGEKIRWSNSAPKKASCKAMREKCPHRKKERKKERMKERERENEKRKEK